MTVLLNVLTLCTVSFAVAMAVVTPTWPENYFVEGTFTLPYVNLEEPISMYYDGAGNRQKISYYNGQDVYLYRYDESTLYEVVPRINTLKCYVQDVGTGPMVTLLPDLSQGWEYVGESMQRGVSCGTWKKIVKNFNKTATYHFYAANGVPVRLYLEGYDFVFGSHPDLYQFDYDMYIPDYTDDEPYTMPDLCEGVKKQNNPGRAHRAKGLLGQLGKLMPREGKTDFEQFAIRFGKHHFKEEIAQRTEIFNANKQLIEAHNKRTDVSHKLAMNHFGDMEFDEWRNVMTPKKNKKPGLKNAMPHVGTGSIPEAIDWREKGGVTPVKDQGACGSCWTFGTTGTIEGAWFAKTGQLVTVSEQQILDCSWRQWASEINTGCDGGFAAPALQWIMDNGGLATEFEYPYMMQDGYCKPTYKSSGVVVKGYVNVTSGSEKALMEAVALGPVAIAIDAAHPEFEYYTGGVYYNPECKNTINDLDHEVLVVGYGSDGPGLDYWIVKNSWSIYWGDKGFIKMARNRDNNCGIATQANYPLV